MSDKYWLPLSTKQNLKHFEKKAFQIRMSQGSGYNQKGFSNQFLYTYKACIIYITPSNYVCIILYDSDNNNY